MPTRSAAHRFVLLTRRIFAVAVGDLVRCRVLAAGGMDSVVEPRHVLAPPGGPP